MNISVDLLSHPLMSAVAAARATQFSWSGLSALALAAVLLPVRSPGAPVNPGLAGKAREMLERALREESGFVRIHAAEALLDTGNGENVPAVFITYLSPTDTGTTNPVRIGIWRVMALASSTPTEREKWISHVRRVALDPTASDWLQAVETLGKLRVQLAPDELQSIRQWAAESAPAIAPFPWWLLKLNGAPDALPKIVAALGTAEPIARLRAAYILKRDKLTGAGAGAALARAWASEPPDSPAYPYVLCAMATLGDDPAQQRECLDRLGKLIAPGVYAAGQYEACLTLMQLWPAENVGKFAHLLGSPDADTRVGAAWAVLYLSKSRP
jgi:hypothetical protein